MAVPCWVAGKIGLVSMLLPHSGCSLISFLCYSLVSVCLPTYLSSLCLSLCLSVWLASSTCTWPAGKSWGPCCWISRGLGRLAAGRVDLMMPFSSPCGQAVCPVVSEPGPHGASSTSGPRLPPFFLPSTPLRHVLSLTHQ